MAQKIQAVNAASDKGYWDEGAATGLAKTDNYFSFGRRDQSDPAGRANTWSFVFLRPDLADMIDASFQSGSTFELYPLYAAPVAIPGRIYGLLGNPAVPTTRAQAQALLASNLTTAYVDWTVPVHVVGQVLTSPDLSAVDAEMAADAARTGATVPWGYIFAPNGITAGAQKICTPAAPNAPSAQWAKKTWNYTPAAAGGGLPSHTSVLNSDRADNFFSVAGGEPIEGNGVGFTGLIDAEIGGTPFDPPPPQTGDPAMDAGTNDYWGKTAAQTIADGWAEVTSSAQLTNLRAAGFTINTNNGYGSPLFTGLASHSPRSHTVLERTNYTIPHFPPSEATLFHNEGVMTIVDQPTGLLLDYFQAQPNQNNGAITFCYQVNGFDALGTGDWSGQSASMDPTVPHTNNRGVRAGGPGYWFGCLHHGHFQRGYVGHKLVCGLDGTQLKSPQVRPARFVDSSAGTYSGLNPPGTQFRLPSGFNMASLSSDAARVLAVALRDYGGIAMERVTGGMVFYATPESSSYVSQISSADRSLIHSSLILLVE